MNRTKNWFRILGAFFALIVTAGLNAQSTSETGSIKGRVTDDKGAPLPGAVIKAKGPQGNKGAESDSNGNYSIPFLTPGAYEVTVSMDGFGTLVYDNVPVVANSVGVQSFKLSSGGDVVNVTAGRNIDVASSTGVTIVDLAQAVNTFSAPRGLAGVFDFAAGVNTGSGLPGGNVSISGASGLENTYLIGGVNVTNSGYGGLGAFDRVSGTFGTGVTTEFLESLDVKESGFEAQDGGNLGGVISANIKSGTNEFHGGVFVYYSPRSLEGERNDIRRPGGFINSAGNNTLDTGFSIGGPILKDKLFFFAAYNPVWSKTFNRFDIDASDLAMDNIVAPNANKEYDFGNGRVDNYALRFTYAITEKHRLDLMAFGSPETHDGLLRSIGRRVNASDNPGVTSAFNVGFNPITETLPTSPRNISDLDSITGASGSSKVTDRSLSLKYLGQLAPWMNLEMQISHHLSRVAEKPAADALSYNDIRRGQVFTAQAGRGLTPIVSPASYTFGGLGGYQGGSNDENTEYSLKITNMFNALGSHELKYGAVYADIKFRENFLRGPAISLDVPALGGLVSVRGGVNPTLRCPSVNPFGTIFYDPIDPRNPNAACRANASLAQGPGHATRYWNMRYQITRGNIGPEATDTTNKELNLFIQDKWTIKNVTLNLGARYTRSEVANHDNFQINSVDYLGQTYKFPSEIAPRLGISWDVMGNGKSKLYASWGRLFERIPNDLAVRAFGNEVSVTGANFKNPDLTGQVGSIQIAGATPTCVAGDVMVGTNIPCVEGASKTRLPFKDDITVGYAFQIAPRFNMEIRGNFRKQGRVLEDTQTATIEAIENYYYNYLIPYCLNCPATQTELFPGEGNAAFGAYQLSNTGENDPKTFTDIYTGEKRAASFGSPSQKYKALSLTLNKEKGEGEHVHLQATYRISKVFGNYEGLFRNDNGQSDPNITSLYDFPESNLTRAQFTKGLLNTDVPHALRVHMAYDDLFIKGLSGSVTFKWNSGTPRTPLLAHPIYHNAGEIPGIDPVYYQFDVNGDSYSDLNIVKDYTAVSRGFNGRNPDTAIWDLGLGYKWILGKSNLDFSVVVNNVFNDVHVSSFNEFVENSNGVENPAYGLPSSTHRPRSIRLGARWSF